MNWEESISLGELDPSKILFVKDEYIHKIVDTLAKTKIVNGHAIGRLGQELNVYASSGFSDDHECVNKKPINADSFNVIAKASQSSTKLYLITYGSGVGID